MITQTALDINLMYTIHNNIFDEMVGALTKKQKKQML